MPSRPLKPCASPRCGALAPAGSRWCAAHRPAALEQQTALRAAHDARRGSAHARGYDARWRAARAAFLAARRWRCAGYQVERCLVPASVVDHITPHRGDPGLFWDMLNWQPLCARCHNRKTATQDGGFRGAPLSPACTESLPRAVAATTAQVQCGGSPLAPRASRPVPSLSLGCV